MDYITRLRNMLIIQSIVLTIRFFNFFLTFSFLSREYMSLIIVQNFFITISKILSDIYNISIRFFYPRINNQRNNGIYYLSQDSFHKIVTFTLTILHQTLNLLIYIFIFLANSYLLSIGLYYDELTLANYYQNSNFVLPVLYSIDDYNSLLYVASDNSISEFFNFILMFSVVYPVLSSIPTENKNIRSNFIIIEGTSITNCKEESICSICWENKCDWSLPCKHQFHYECIRKWYIDNNKNSCPYCRCSIKKTI